MNSVKKNNSGFTLIELLITIVILGIIAVPFINSFIQAININTEARRLQNATLAAQDVAEEFKAEPLSDLLDKYAHSITSETDKLDVYKFDTMEVTGVDGEDFFITVTLDPNVVFDKDGNCINGKLLPMFSNLYGGDTLIMYKQYVETDSTVERASHKKISNITILCNEVIIGTSNYSYTYTIKIENSYEKADGTTIAAPIRTIEKTYSGTDKQTIYLLASLFDRTTALLTDTDANYYSTDRINIKFEYVGDSGRQPDFTFYLAEQPTKNLTNDQKLSRLNPENINITYGANTKTLNEYDSASNKFKINTNVGQKMDLTEEEDSALTGNLTYDPNNVGESLFLMDIVVRYRSADGKVLTTFSSTKEE